MNNKTTLKQYDLIDLVKYVGSIFVVFIHTLSSGIGMQLGGILGRFAVPFFLIVSAYFFKRKLSGMQDVDLQIQYYSLRIFKLYLFWLVVNLPCIAYGTLHFFRESQFSLGKASFIFIIRCLYNAVPGYGISWYLTASIFSAWVLGKLAKRFSSIALVGMTFPFFLVSVFSSMYGVVMRSFSSLDMWCSLFPPANSIFAGLFFFALGMLLFEYRGFWIDGFSIKWILSLAAVSLLGVLLEGNFAIIRHLPYSPGTTDQYFMLVPFVFLLTIICFKVPVKLKHARSLRRASTVTYLSQFIFIWGIKFVCFHFGIELNQYVLAFLTIIGTFILYLLLDSLEKRYPFKIFRCAF